MTGATAARGYGGPHQKVRATLTPIVHRGDAWCTEPICLEPDRWIPPNTAWDLAHDRINGGYLGPAHARCNRSEGATHGNTQRTGASGGSRFLGSQADDAGVINIYFTESDVRYSGLLIRPGLLWAAHVESAPEWLAPFLEVPDDAAPPLAMTPVHPAAVGSYGPEAIAWAEKMLGHPLRWWQKLAVVRQLEHDAQDCLCWRNVLESASRRVGKSVRLRLMALWRLAHGDLFGEPQLAIHTGKDLFIVREILFKAIPWARANGWEAKTGMGQEQIQHAEHRWVARSPKTVYGYDVTLGMVDESWDVEEQAITDGLEPTTLERLSPQVVLTSTAHRRATGLMRTRIRDALTVDDGETLLMLWAAADGADMGLQATWRAASAHWSEDRARMLAAKYAKASSGEHDLEFDDPDPMAGFASQYLNRWQLGRVRADTAIDPALWAACAAPAGRVDEPWFAVEVESGLLSASIASGGQAEAGRCWVDVERRAGVDWVPGRLVELGVASVAMDLRGAAAALTQGLWDAGVWVVPIDTGEAIQACGELQADVLVGRVVNPELPVLDDAVAAAQKRDVGDQGGWVFGRKKSGRDISALQACAWALWLWRNHEDPAIWRRR